MSVGLTDSETCVATVQKVVRALLHEGYPSLPRAAAAMGTSPRTLQRRLHAAGVNYSDIVNDVRLDRAIELLEDTIMPLQDIASALGYSQPASLSRLIARKMGKQPREVREESTKQPPISHREGTAPA